MKSSLQLGQRVRRNYGDNQHISGTVVELNLPHCARVQWDNCGLPSVFQSNTDALLVLADEPLAILRCRATIDINFDLIRPAAATRSITEYAEQMAQHFATTCTVPDVDIKQAWVDDAYEVTPITGTSDHDPF
jgi:hypothetical protein